MNRAEPPPFSVRAAFGAPGEPERLSGGQGRSWRAGEIVLKPLDLAPAELDWQAELLAGLDVEGIRVARPLRAADGSTSIDGWCAREYLAGAHEPRRWADVIAAGERFHRALRAVPRPAFLDARADPWSVGDRAAWGELPASDYAEVEHVPRLVSALRPLDERSQPDASVLDAVAHVDRFGQYLLRALIYRAVTERVARPHEPARSDDSDPYLAPVELALALAARESAG